MKRATIQQTKANLSRLIELASSGEEIVITRGKEPVVRLVPLTAPKGQRRPGNFKGKQRIGPEFFQPLPASELDAWQ